MRPQCQLTHGDSSILLTGQLTLTYTSPGFAYMHILMTTSLLTTFFRGAPKGLLVIITTRLYVNKTGITQCPHCQSSFCPPLKISFQSRFSMFDNISHVMIWISTTVWQHFMRTYIIIFGVRPNLVISCCIPAIPRFILQSDVKDT